MDGGKAFAVPQALLIKDPKAAGQMDPYQSVAAQKAALSQGGYIVADGYLLKGIIIPEGIVPHRGYSVGDHRFGDFPTIIVPGGQRFKILHRPAAGNRQCPVFVGPFDSIPAGACDGFRPGGDCEGQHSQGCTENQGKHSMLHGYLLVVLKVFAPEKEDLPD